MIEPQPLDLTSPSVAPQSAPLDLSTATDLGTVPEAAIASDRASKAAYGARDMSEMTYPEFLEKIQQGQEKEARQKMAADLSSFRMDQITQDLQARAYNGTLDTPTLLAAAQYNVKVNPDTVIEKAFANRYMDNFHAPDNELLNQFSDNPHFQNAVLNMGKDRIAKYQIALKEFQDRSIDVQNQGWLPWITDFLTNQLPLKTSLNLRSGLSFMGLGADLERQRQELNQLPVDQYGPALKARLNSISNPQLREDFARANLGQSFREEEQRSFAEGLDLLISGQITKGIAKGTLRAGEGFAIKRAVRKAVQDLAESAKAAETKPIGTAVDAGLGKVAEAGIQQQAVDIAKEVTGNPSPKAAVNGLSSVDSFDVQVGVQSGNFGQEVANRIRAWIDVHTQLFIDKITNPLSMRINRTPALAIEAVQQEVYKAVKANFKGPSNMVINVDNLRWEFRSNTYHVDIHIGNPDGTMFVNERLAINAANTLGINLRPAAVGSLTDLEQRMTALEARLPRAAAAPRTDLTQFKNFSEYRTAQRAKGIKSQDMEFKNSIDFEEARKAPTPVAPVKDISEYKNFTEYRDAMRKQGIKDLPIKNSIEFEEARKAATVPTAPTTPVVENIQQYKNYTEYRAAMRQQGIKDLPIKNSIDFEAAKKAAAEAPTTAPVTPAPYVETIPTSPEGATIEQQGLHWYIRSTVPIRDIYVRNYLLQLADTQNPVKWFSAFKNYLGWVRSAADTLSMEERQAREIAVHVPKVYRGIMQSLLEPITNLPRSQIGDFKSLLLDGQANNRYLTNALDLKQWYLTNRGRAPTEAELTAYASYYKAAQLDRAMREMGAMRNLWRYGAEEHSFTIKMPDGTTLESPKFNGVIRKEFPKDWDGTILIIGQKPEDTKVSLIGKLGGLRAKLIKDITEGRMQLVQVHASEQMPFQGLLFHGATDPRIQYVAAPVFRTNPIPWGQTNKVPHHFMPEYGHYVSKARINPELISKDTYHWYDGDIFLAGVNNRALGQDFSKHMTEAQRLYVSGDEAAARAYVAQHTSIDPDTFVSWYQPSKDVYGNVVPPKLTKDVEPFQVVRNGSYIGDVDTSLRNRYPGTFRDGTREGSLRQQANTEYGIGQEADQLYSLRADGTKANPMFHLEKPDFVDPLTSLNRGLSRIIDTLFMDDYRAYVAEHWTQQARPWLLKFESKSPYLHLQHPEWSPNMPQEIKAQLMDNRGKSLHFISAPDYWDTITYSMSQSIMDSIYTKGGPTITPEWQLGKVTNPSQLLRSFATHAVLGFWSIKQFFNNMSTWATIMAFSPKSTPAATTATYLYGLTRFNKSPEFIASLDKLITNMALPGVVDPFHHMRPGWFTEAMNLLDNTGFAQVGAEHAFTQGITADRIVSRGFQKLTDAGLAPWTLGSSAVRTVAFMTSYMEKKMLNPTASWTRKSLQELLERAGTLDINMSRAGASRANTLPGVANATQFLSYEMRLSELMLGKRITPAEKMRWLFMNSMLFGVPSTLGVMMLPFGDWVRKAEIDHLKYLPGENPQSTIPNEGLVGWATGQDVTKFGLRGAFESMFKTDATIWSIVGGAPYQTAATMVQNLNPFWRAGVDWINGQGHFTIKPQHFLKAAEILSSGSDLDRMIVAWTTGDWMSRNGNLLEKDIAPLRAFLQTIMGTQPLKVKHGYAIAEITKAREELQKRAEKLALQEMYYAYRSQDNPQQFQEYLINALSYLKAGDYSEEQYSHFWSTAAEHNREFVDKVAWEYATKHAPEGKRQNLMEYYTRAMTTMRNRKTQ